MSTDQRFLDGIRAVELRRWRLPLSLLGMALLAAVTGGSPLRAQTKLLRFPDLHGGRVVFTYAGDLWLAPAAPGEEVTANRLTSHPGLELFGKFSPAGDWIAFTGQYDGDEQVYVVPTAGGSPRQLTFYPANGPLPPRWGYDNQVYGWTPDGEKVLFRSMRDGWDLSDTRLYTVDREGALPLPLPMPVSGAGDFSPDGGRVVYSPLVRDFRHWKRYQGGWAQDLFIFDLTRRTARAITDHPRSDRDPMWIGEEIYFTSDRDGVLNLYRFDPASGSLEQLTHSDLWDLRWPSADPRSGRIVFERAGELEILDTRSRSIGKLSVRVPTDGLAMRPGRVSAAELIEGAGLSPRGERVLFAARGDVFTTPIEHGSTRNLTRSPGAHDREPAWSPDGRRIAFVSDLSGEEEIYLVEQDGHGEPEALTDNSTGRYYDLAWSPPGTHLAFRNQEGKLFVLGLEDRERQEVAHDPAAFGLGYEWSPDGRHLAFSMNDSHQFSSIFLWSLEESKLHRVTDELWNEFSPSWGRQGRYLYFIGDREFGAQLGSFEHNYVVDRESYVYALALRSEVEHPFPPRSDEVTLGDEDGAKQETDEKPPEEETESLGIDYRGLAGRVARVPIAADNYAALAAIDGHLLVLRTGASYAGRTSEQRPELLRFSLEERELESVVSDVRALALSADGAKLLVHGANGWEVLGVEGNGSEGKRVETAGLRLDRVPAAEWAQIFDEVWRRFRDFFYVENLHGYDWEGLRRRYRPLLAHVAHRSDLNYLLSEMISELNVSHAYVSGGDLDLPERPPAALLGARLAADPERGRYRLERILPGHNEEPTYRSPLTEIGVGVEAGDYLLAINGVELTTAENPYRLLRHAGGRPLELVVAAGGDLDRSRRVVVEPIDDEDPLLYLGWVETNRRLVGERTDGRVGYLHLPDMGSAGLREFVKWFYGQVRRAGLVIDVRSNGGGNVSSMILERLGRELLMVDFERNLGHPDPYPSWAFHGHLVCLLDEDTASDGDQFAWAFREAGLGPLIGKRSWGGVVGIYGRGPLLDGGSVSVPEAGSADRYGRWVIEGHGVEPDYVVENDPESVLDGRDPQLEKGIEVILEMIEREPRRLPERPQPPVKTE